MEELLIGLENLLAGLSAVDWQSVRLILLSVAQGGGPSPELIELVGWRDSSSTQERLILNLPATKAGTIDEEGRTIGPVVIDIRGRQLSLTPAAPFLQGEAESVSISQSYFEGNTQLDNQQFFSLTLPNPINSSELLQIILNNTENNNVEAESILSELGLITQSERDALETEISQLIYSVNWLTVKGILEDASKKFQSIDQNPENLTYLSELKKELLLVESNKTLVLSLPPRAIGEAREDGYVVGEILIEIAGDDLQVDFGQPFALSGKVSSVTFKEGLWLDDVKQDEVELATLPFFNEKSAQSLLAAIFNNIKATSSSSNAFEVDTKATLKDLGIDYLVDTTTPIKQGNLQIGVDFTSASQMKSVVFSELYWWLKVEFPTLDSEDVTFEWLDDGHPPNESQFLEYEDSLVISPPTGENSKSYTFTATNMDGGKLFHESLTIYKDTIASDFTSQANQYESPDKKLKSSLFYTVEGKIYFSTANETRGERISQQATLLNLSTADRSDFDNLVRHLYTIYNDFDINPKVSVAREATDKFKIAVPNYQVYSNNSPTSLQRGVKHENINPKEDNYATFKELSVLTVQTKANNSAFITKTTISSSNHAGIITAEKQFLDDYNGDQIIGDGIIEDLGFGLYTTAMNHLIWSPAWSSQPEVPPRKYGDSLPEASTTISNDGKVLQELSDSADAGYLASRKIILGKDKLKDDLEIIYAKPAYIEGEYEDYTYPQLFKSLIYDNNTKKITARNLKYNDIFKYEIEYDKDFNGDGHKGNVVVAHLDFVHPSLYLTSAAELLLSEKLEVGKPASGSFNPITIASNPLQSMLELYARHGENLYLFSDKYGTPHARAVALGRDRVEDDIEIVQPVYSENTRSQISLFVATIDTSLKPGPKLTSRSINKVSEILKLENSHTEDFNRDGVIGDGLINSFGDGLFSTASDKVLLFQGRGELPEAPSDESDLVPSDFKALKVGPKTASDLNASLDNIIEYGLDSKSRPIVKGVSGSSFNGFALAFPISKQVAGADELASEVTAVRVFEINSDKATIISKTFSGSGIISQENIFNHDFNGDGIIGLLQIAP